jgi:protein ImuB
VIPAGKEAERLGELPLDVLSPTPEMLETFDRWGVRTLRALAALPEVSLSERLGQEGLRLRALARGEGKRLLVPLEAALDFRESMELQDPVELLEPLAFILGRLLDQLCANLAARALSTNELRLTLTLDASQQAAEAGLAAICARSMHERTIRLPLPLRNPKTFLKLLQLDLQAHPPEAPVVKVEIAAEAAKPRSAQTGLFLPKTPEPERLELTLARIAGIVGAENVGVAELRDSHRPSAFAMRRFVTAETSSASGGGRASRRSTDVQRRGEATRDEARDGPSPVSTRTLALRIFRPPLPARVWVRDGVPIRVHFRGMRGIVIGISGPWRTSGEWWNAEKWTCDEWEVALERVAGRQSPVTCPLTVDRSLLSEKGRSSQFAGRREQQASNAEEIALYRIVRDVQSDQWFAAGNYD